MREQKRVSVLGEPGGARYPAGLSSVCSPHLCRVFLVILSVLTVAPALVAGGKTILGTVRDRRTGAPVASAGIQILDRSGNQYATATTNSLGPRSGSLV